MSSHVAQSRTAPEKKRGSYRVESWFENGKSVERVTHDCYLCGQPVRGAAIIRVPPAVIVAWEESERRLAKKKSFMMLNLSAVLAPTLMLFFWLLLWSGVHEFPAAIAMLIVGTVGGLFSLVKFAIPAYERYEREERSGMGNMLPTKYRGVDIRSITTERYLADKTEYILLEHGCEW